MQTNFLSGVETGEDLSQATSLDLRKFSNDIRRWLSNDRANQPRAPLSYETSRISGARCEVDGGHIPFDNYIVHYLHDFE